jgi:hypothetical protein
MIVDIVSSKKNPGGQYRLRGLRASKLRTFCLIDSKALGAAHFIGELQRSKTSQAADGLTARLGMPIHTSLNLRCKTFARDFICRP